MFILSLFDKLLHIYPGRVKCVLKRTHIEMSVCVCVCGVFVCFQGFPWLHHMVVSFVQMLIKSLTLRSTFSFWILARLLINKWKVQWSLLCAYAIVISMKICCSCDFLIIHIGCPHNIGLAWAIHCSSGFHIKWQLFSHPRLNHIIKKLFVTTINSIQSIKRKEDSFRLMRNF